MSLRREKPDHPLRYRLLKDLPSVKAGAIYEYKDRFREGAYYNLITAKYVANTYLDKNGNHPYSGGSFDYLTVENNPKWFQLISEKEQ